MFVVDLFLWLPKWVIIYLDVLCKYLHTKKGVWVLGYPTQDSKFKIPSRKYQIIIHEYFPSHSFPLFLYTIIFELKIQNHYCAQNNILE